MLFGLSHLHVDENKIIIIIIIISQIWLTSIKGNGNWAQKKPSSHVSVDTTQIKEQLSYWVAR